MSDEKGVECWGVLEEDGTLWKALPSESTALRATTCADRTQTVKRCLLTPIKEEKKVEVTRSQVEQALR